MYIVSDLEGQTRGPQTTKVCSHVTSTCPCPWKSLSQFIIVSMLTVSLTDTVGSRLILSVKVTVTVYHCVYADSVFDGHSGL